MACSYKKGWGGSSLRKKHLGIYDKKKKHVEKNCRIEKRCLKTSNRRHTKTDCKTNPSIEISEEPEGL
jgi:hypothetical protein